MYLFKKFNFRIEEEERIGPIELNRLAEEKKKVYYISFIGGRGCRKC